MITSMIAYEILLWIFISNCYDSLPSWAKAICLVAWLAIHAVAFGSEDNLRDKVKHLEKEIKNLKKGGE